jgi:transcriptional regulator with XRE-family HTH domain
MSSIGKRINDLVKYFSNGNNSDFAAKIGISEANIRNYINDRSEPKFNIIEKIAINFEINYEWLLTGEGEMLKEKTTTAENLKNENNMNSLETLELLKENNALLKENNELFKQNVELANRIKLLEDELRNSGKDQAIEEAM